MAAALNGGAPAVHGLAAEERAPSGVRRAAVLMLLSDSSLATSDHGADLAGGADDSREVAVGFDPDVVLTERAASLRSHPSQIAFPGGGLDSGETAVDAALRETHEEIGLAPASVHVLGALPDAHVNASRFDVTVVVGTWSGDQPVSAVDPNEVASVHRVRVRDLADPHNRVTATLPQGYEGPAFQVDGVFVWGFTAHVLDHALELGGWSLPWDREHRVEVPVNLWRS